MKNPTDIKAVHITSELPLYEVYLIKMTPPTKSSFKIIHSELAKPTGLLPRSAITLFYFLSFCLMFSDAASVLLPS